MTPANEPVNFCVEDSSLFDNPNRDLESLVAWAVLSGVEFAPGVKISENKHGGWGVALTQPQEQGTAIMTIPNRLILASSSTTSDSKKNDNEAERRRQWMEEAMISMGDPHNQQYVPECLLMLRVLEEVSKGEASLWHTWLQSLPRTFSTGQYLDTMEREVVKRMAPQYLEHQDRQWETCRNTLVSFLSDNEPAKELKNWWMELNDDDYQEMMLKWAFSVVFTRSWRTPDRKDATIVPLGDMVNHDSQRANIRPSLEEEPSCASLQLCLTESLKNVNEKSNGAENLYLSYGISEYPARFLVVFGFCDVSAPYVHVGDFLKEDPYVGGLLKEDALSELPPIDMTQLVVSTANGTIAEEVWNVFLYKVLQQRDPLQLQSLRDAFERNPMEADAVLQDLMTEWEYSVARALQAHIQNILDNIYPQMMLNELVLGRHPRLAMITNYNQSMRTIFSRVFDHVTLVLEQAQKVRRLTGSLKSIA